MIKLASWNFRKKNIPMEERYKLKNQLRIYDICIFGGVDPSGYIKHDVCLLSGDGGTLPDDVNRFKGLGVGYDVFCINRSMLFFEEPITHWAAIDAEESVWFSENLSSKVVPAGGRILKHTIGFCPTGYDVFWKVDQQFQNERQKDLWSGNSGYFGVLAALKMGYRKVVICGMPLDTKPHWYEPAEKEGPNWVGQTYRTWIDFKTDRPEADRVRSMSGYSEFIFGKVDRSWLTR